MEEFTMKRILSLTLLLGLTSTQMPMHAELKSEVASWVRKELGRVEYKQGIKAVAADAVNLGKAACNLGVAAYNALPTKEAALEILAKSTTVAESALRHGNKIIEKYPNAAFIGSFIAAGALSAEAERINTETQTPEEKELRELSVFIADCSDYLIEWEQVANSMDNQQRINAFKKLKEKANTLQLKYTSENIQRVFIALKFAMKNIEHATTKNTFGDALHELDVQVNKDFKKYIRSTKAYKAGAIACLALSLYSMSKNHIR